MRGLPILTDASTRRLDFGDIGNRFNGNYNCFTGQDATSDPENFSRGPGTQFYRCVHLSARDAGKLQDV